MLSDAETDIDFGDGENSVHTEPESIAASSVVPSLANSALSDFNRLMSGAKANAKSDPPLQGVWKDDELTEEQEGFIAELNEEEDAFQSRMNTAAVKAATDAATEKMQALLSQTSAARIAEAAKKQKEKDDVRKLEQRKAANKSAPPSRPPPPPPAPRRGSDVPSHLPPMGHLIKDAPPRDLDKRIPPPPPPARPVPQPPRPPSGSQGAVTMSGAKANAAGRKAEDRENLLKPTWMQHQSADVSEEQFLFADSAPITPPEIHAFDPVGQDIGSTAAAGTPPLVHPP